MKKYILIIMGIIFLSSTSVYAVSAIIDSKEVSYDNTKSKGSFKDVQSSIDELYKKSYELRGKQDTLYKEDILNGADPVLGEGMIPVTIDDDGNVKYANLYTEWYSYAEKMWANAIILKSGSYETGDIIDKKDIESYFVWIPKYSYKIWDLGNYTDHYELEDIVDTKESAKDDPKALRHITGKARLIDIRFGSDENETTQEIDSYYTHPAFTSFGVKGLWVGKFETSKSDDNIQVLPGVASWRNEKVGTFWDALYNYKNLSGNHNEKLDPHMMKNTEWGSVAYLSHSIYGKGSEVNVNNNSSYLTGYSAASNTDQSSYPGTRGTKEEDTQPYNTPTGYLASTTGNITGVYDMSGGAHEYMAAYRKGQNATTSGINPEEKESKYFDVYEDSIWTSYDKRILGDATGEMGPFYYYYDSDGASAKYKRTSNSWYSDNSNFIDSTSPWFHRGGTHYYGALAGQFYFNRTNGDAYDYISSRLVLAVK